MNLDDEIAAIPPAEQVAAFASVTAEPGDVLEIRTKPDDGPILQNWCYARDLPEMMPKLRRSNQAKRHIYISANPRRDFGLAGDVNVPLARCVFIDQDPSNGFTRIPDLIDRIAGIGLPEASAVMNSGHGAWAFWRLAGPMLDLDLWRTIQRRLCLALGTDTAARNPERMTRCPGFMNWKAPAAYAWLYSVDPTRRYPLPTILRALPKLLPESPPPPRRMLAPTGTTHDDLLRRARMYVASVRECGEGARNREVFRLSGHVASFVDEHGQCLNEDEIILTMHAFNDRCIPPLQEKEFVTAVRSALKHGKAREAKPPRPQAPHIRLAMVCARGEK